MTDKEWYKMKENYVRATKEEYDKAVDNIFKAELPYSDDLVLKYLIAKEKYRITYRNYWCACRGKNLKDWLDPR